MTLNVRTKNFLSVLRQLNVDISNFPDKSFSGLCDSKQNELNYFLDWFIENIGSDNALTDIEINTYSNFLSPKNKSLSEEELNLALSKCSISYEEVVELDESYVQNALTELSVALDEEICLLHSIASDLELKCSERKKKLIQSQEDCNALKKKLIQTIEEFNFLKSDFCDIKEDFSTFNLNSDINVISLSTFVELMQQEDELLDLFRQQTDLFDKSSFSFNSKDTSQVTKLSENCATAKYLSFASNGVFEEVHCKILNATKFLNTLRDDSESHFTFDAALNIWCDENKMNMFNELKKEVEYLQNVKLIQTLKQAFDLQFDKFLTKWNLRKLCEKESQVIYFSQFIRHIKRNIFFNSILLYIINKSVKNEENFIQVTDNFYSRLKENECELINIFNSLNWRSKNYEEFEKEIFRRHPFVLSCKKMHGNEQINDHKNMFLTRACHAVNFVIKNLGSLLTPFGCKLEHFILSLLHNINYGPTRQIQIYPIELQIEFFTCEELIARYSHNIKQLLTTYVDIKNFVMSADRSKMLIWIDFLTNPQKVVNKLKEKQSNSLEAEEES